LPRPPEKFSCTSAMKGSSSSLYVGLLEAVRIAELGIGLRSIAPALASPLASHRINPNSVTPWLSLIWWVGRRIVGDTLIVIVYHPLR